MVIVTPNVAHARCALAAVRRGLHVLVEKPMALTDEECGLMIAAAHETGVMCAVLHCMNWSPALAAARASLSSGAIPLPSSLPCQAAPEVPANIETRNKTTIFLIDILLI